VNEGWVESNTENWDERQQAVEYQASRKKRLLVLAASCLIVLLAGAGVAYALTRPEPTLLDQAEALVAAAEELDCTAGLRVTVSRTRVTESDQAEVRRYHQTYSALLRQRGADAVAFSVGRTEDGRGRAVIAAIDCPDS
jgi:hypothetical protein